MVAAPPLGVAVRRALWLLAAALIAAPAPAAEPEARHIVVVSGIGGEEFYRDQFRRWSLSFVDLAQDQFGIDPEQVLYLTEEPEQAPQRATGRSTKEEIGRVLNAVAERSAPGDLVLVLLIGHGTARGDRILFNIPGPDLSAAELSALLAPLRGRRLVVVNTASSSGPFLRDLSAPDRVVITATSTAAENQHPRFGGHFVTAFAAAAADRDKDGRVSLLEAFSHATGEVARTFENEKRLRTEHALLDDDGDGVGTPAPGGTDTDGRLAARLFLTRADAPAGSSPEALALTVAARGLVDRIELLKRRKGEMLETDYQAQLEALLVELALNRRAYRRGQTP